MSKIRMADANVLRRKEKSFMKRNIRSNLVMNGRFFFVFLEHLHQLNI